MAAIPGPPPADLVFKVSATGSASGVFRGVLPWSNTAKVVSSCDCLSAERPTDDAGPTTLRVDLSHEPDAHSFAPFVQLLDAAGRELARVTLDIEIEGRR